VDWWVTERQRFRVADRRCFDGLVYMTAYTLWKNRNAMQSREFLLINYYDKKLSRKTLRNYENNFVEKSRAQDIVHRA
jgi:hypothetical protein